MQSDLTTPSHLKAAHIRQNPLNALSHWRSERPAPKAENKLGMNIDERVVSKFIGPRSFGPPRRLGGIFSYNRSNVFLVQEKRFDKPLPITSLSE